MIKLGLLNSEGAAKEENGKKQRPKHQSVAARLKFIKSCSNIWRPQESESS